jgi:hypothetical protein
MMSTMWEAICTSWEKWSTGDSGYIMCIEDVTFLVTYTGHACVEVNGVGLWGCFAVLQVKFKYILINESVGV